MILAAASTPIRHEHPKASERPETGRLPGGRVVHAAVHVTLRPEVRAPYAEPAAAVHADLDDVHLSADELFDYPAVDLEVAPPASGAAGAATMLAFALSHEQLPAAYRFLARPALERREAELPAERLAAARATAAKATLVELSLL
jgi:hypothetical protein